MNAKLIELFKRAQEFHGTMYSELQSLAAQYKSSNSPEDLADYAFVFREIGKYVDDVRKECLKARELCEKIACMIWIKDQSGESIRTPYCTAVPKIKMVASVPKQRTQPERYAKLMNYLGIPQELWLDREPLVQVYWPGFVEYVSELESQGLPLPAGLEPEKAYAVCSLHMTRRKAIDE